MMFLDNTSCSNIEGMSKQNLELVVSKKSQGQQSELRQKRVEVVDRKDFQRKDHGILERSLAIWLVTSLVHSPVDALRLIGAAQSQKWSSAQPSLYPTCGKDFHDMLVSFHLCCLHPILHFFLVSLWKKQRILDAWLRARYHGTMMLQHLPSLNHCHLTL